MTDESTFQADLFHGLEELAQSAFPKQCANCGRRFETAEQFLKETEDLHQTKTGIKQGEDDDGNKIVEVFRNCPCGSTLLELFNDRRDMSEAGIKRRKKFDELLTMLLEHDLEREVARAELIKLLRGERSELLSNIKAIK